MEKELILLIVPVLLSGITFIFFLKFFNRDQKSSILNFPIDFNRTFNNKRIFGENKTIKGPLFMGILTMFYGTIIYFSLLQVPKSPITDLLIPYYFLLMGLSYSLGELPNSFLKRQLSIIPGEKANGSFAKRTFFKLSDTFDSLIAVGLIGRFLFGFSVGGVLIAILLGGIIHLMTDKVMARMKLK